MRSRWNVIKAFLFALLITGLLALAGGASVWQNWRQSPRSLQAAPPDQPSDFDQPTVAESPAANSAEPLLSFFLLSDIHMATGNSAVVDKLNMALSDITDFESRVDTIVLGGDLVDGGRESDYQLLQEIFAAYSLPKLYALMGNHEYYGIWYNENGDWSSKTVPNGKTDAQAREHFMRFMGQDRPHQDAWVNGVHLIMLSQEAYIQERPEVGEGAWYSDEQLAWLQETMKQHVDGKPAFIFIHQPLPPDGEDGGQHRVIRNREFRSILSQYRNVFVFSGHTHRNLENPGHYVRDTTFHWFSNASVGRTRSGGSVQTPVQGLYVQVYPDRVVVRGREFSNRRWITAAKWSIGLE